MAVFVGLTRPNAIGKTRAVRRWAARYAKLVVVSRDASPFCICDGVEQRDRRWLGKEHVLEQAVDEYGQRYQNRVIVIESSRPTHIKFFPAGSQVIAVTCTPEALRRFIRERCKRKDKRYRAGIWEGHIAEYEARRRHLLLCSKLPSSFQWAEFQIEDRKRDWLAVDRYFINLYHYLHNWLNRPVQ